MIHSRLQVDALSELFVAWDDVLIETENKVTNLRATGLRVARSHYDTQIYAPSCDRIACAMQNPSKAQSCILRPFQEASPIIGRKRRYFW